MTQTKWTQPSRFRKTLDHMWCLLFHGKYHHNPKKQPVEGQYIRCDHCHTVWWEPL